MLMGWLENGKFFRVCIYLALCDPAPDNAGARRQQEAVAEG